MVPEKYKIRKIYARQVLDSRGNPTVEAEVATDSAMGHAIVPSGASKGTHEAFELRDGAHAYQGKSVYRAIRNVNEVIHPKLRGKDVREQTLLDYVMLELDGTPHKSKLGANAILAVSLALARAAAAGQDQPLYEYLRKYRFTNQYRLPVPFMNVINGGLHANNGLSFQEYMLVPCGRSFSQSLQMAVEVYHTLKTLIDKRYGPGSTAVGDEGGFAPHFKNDEEPLQLLVQAIRKAGHSGRVQIAMDCAASDFYKEGRYHLNKKWHTAEQLLLYYEHLLKRYPLVSIEDPFHEDDFLHFSLLNRRHGNQVRIVGDDLLVTNVERIQHALDSDACNTLLLKVNQIGTLTEAVQAAQLAYQNGWKVMVSHRSGETEDSFIADLSVGLSTGMIKTGAPCRGERTAKYNQLLRIEEELKSKACYVRI